MRRISRLSDSMWRSTCTTRCSMYKSAALGRVLENGRNVKPATLTILCTLALAGPQARGQTPATEVAPATNTPPTAIASEAPAWNFAVSVYGYLVPESRDYAQPTVTADRDWLHLEARYNYEALDTGSAWLGYNLGGGQTLAWELTPMLGGVFGDLTAIAPGYKGSLRWWKLELYSEGEYAFDTRDSSDSFFYNWSELTLAPIDGFRFGLATQRTLAYQSDRDIQRGVLAGITYKAVNFTTYVFNPDESKPTVVLVAGVNF